MKFLKSLARSEHGATAIEYCMLLAMLAMTMLTMLDNLGFTLAGVFDTVSNAMRGS